jgi:DedD protein
MAFFKFRTRGPQGNEGRNTVAAAPAESIEAMRRRARHRLLGAAVLVLIGVVGFPLLFDTQPRPISVDIPIDIPDRNKAKPLALPTPAATAAPGTDKPVAAAPATSGGGMITEAADGSEIPPGKLAAATPAAEPTPEPKPAPKAEARPEPKPEPKPKPEAKSEPKPEPKPAPKPAAVDDAARARALLEGKPTTVAAAAAAATKPAADDNGRFVVQVGAFADADKAKEVRQKLEKSGLKTYTSVAKTADGERTRVRVGPFASRAEADRAAAKVKGLSLSASVLSL